MKMLLAIFTTVFISTTHAEIFNIDTGHADIGFSIKHMMVSNTRGAFNTFEGTVDYDFETDTLNGMQGTIQAASIDTNNDKRDKHLRNKDFFNVSKYPEITFRTSAVEKTGEQTFKVTGKLNILGTDHEVVLPITINGPVEDRRGFKRIGIESETVLNRRELGITNSPAAVIGDEVKISLQLEATYK